MNLFKKIWNRNFIKGKESLDKMSSDLGGLEGNFKWTKIINGIAVESNSFNNAITNISKSTVIRLLGQGVSPYKGIIDPTQYKLSRMRFGNVGFSSYSSDDEKTLTYYDTNEYSARQNLYTYSRGSVTNHKVAGGRWHPALGKASEATGTLPKDSSSQISKIYSATSSEIGGPNFPLESSTFFTIILPDSANSSSKNYRPPSHKTLSVSLINSGTSDIVLSKINFVSVYSKNSNGNTSTSVTPAVSGDPLGSSWSAGDYFANQTISLHTITYDSVNKYWVIKISYPSTFSSLLRQKINKIKVDYEVGLYNVVKSIVPKTGYNTGSFSSGALNFYDVNSDPIYLDSPSSYVDDYSITLNVTMNANEGNGVTDSTSDSLEPVVYTEAFLFNSKDDLFSIIKMELPQTYSGISPSSANIGFAKNSESAYLISWTIRALL